MRKKKVSRAYYKIKEIDERESIFLKEESVLELGSFPGGWTQYILERYKKIFLVSIDKKEVFFKKKKHIFIKGDILDNKVLDEILKIKKKFDLIISDVCINVSGINIIDSSKSNLVFERISLIGRKFLKRGKNLLFKNLSECLYKTIKKKFNYFDRIKFFRLKFRKKRSSENFVFCIKKK
ncbi:Ribosomal RNA large subunit methyltransferase E [Candidatus Vidania fulgoroideae]|nr:Ribosomal RNA large subunit methyltransferase E [Candidatus Vidania fulgoroideae]